MVFKFPSPPPRPPLPGEFPFEVESDEELKESLGLTTEQAFREEMAAQGYNLELIEMGVKVALNHLKTPTEAFRIGREYVRSMSK